MNLKIREIIGFLISLGLLILYSVVLWDILDLVKDWKVNDPEVPISDAELMVLNGVGGLVSAVVIMTLGITKRGKAPTASVRELSKDLGEIVMAVLVIAYLLVWVVLGGLVIYYGVFKFPDSSSTINELGQAWFGLFIGAAYAYIGIHPKNP
jgi:hypothetical protein